MSEENPSYYAIIPATVRYDSELLPLAKLFYGEITCLANSSGVCFAGDAYFAELYGISERHVRRIITILKKQKYITVENKPNRRYIRIASQEVVERTYKSAREDIQVRSGEDIQVRHNNTSINIKNNNIYTAEFDLWWEKYPKKVGEQQAYKNYCYWIEKGYTHKDLIAARDNYIREVQNMNTELQYIKKPSNFLGRNNFFVDYISVEQEPIAKAAVVHEPIKNAISEILKDEWYE